MRVPLGAAVRLGTCFLVPCTVAHEEPCHAVKAFAARSRWWTKDVHAATSGGPRGSAPGCKVSMQTIRPLWQCGHSQSDTPVSR